MGPQMPFLVVLIPFLILGIGADDLFIFIDAWRQAGQPHSYHARSYRALGYHRCLEAGRPITQLPCPWLPSMLGGRPANHTVTMPVVTVPVVTIDAWRQAGQAHSHHACSYRALGYHRCLEAGRPITHHSNQNGAASGFEMCFAIGSQRLGCRGPRPKHVSNPAIKKSIKHEFGLILIQFMIADWCPGRERNQAAARRGAHHRREARVRTQAPVREAVA